MNNAPGLSMMREPYTNRGALDGRAPIHFTDHPLTMGSATMESAAMELAAMESTTVELATVGLAVELASRKLVAASHRGAMKFAAKGWMEGTPVCRGEWAVEGRMETTRSLPRNPIVEFERGGSTEPRCSPVFESAMSELTIFNSGMFKSAETELTMFDSWKPVV